MPSPIISRNPERTRRRLLRAGIRLFSARGYDGVSVDDIVSAARVNKRMVYHYFGSKADIYKAVLQEVYHLTDRTELEAMETEGTPLRKLERLVESGFVFLEDNPDYVRLLLWENLALGKHLAQQEHLLSKTLLHRFEEIVADGIKRGDFRPDLDARHLMINIIGLSFIYHSNRYSLSQGMDMDLSVPKVRQQGMQHAIKLIFQGITVTKGKTVRPAKASPA